MIKISRLCWRTLLLLCVFLFISLEASAQERPYVVSYSPGTVFHALVRDRVKVLYERAGLPVEFVARPHKRSIADANAGNVDAEAGRVSSVEQRAPNLRRVDVVIMNLAGAAYVRGSAAPEYSEALLDQKEVGMVLGVQWSQKLMKERHAHTVKDYAALFDMLIIGRIELALGTTESAESVLESNPERYKQILQLKPVIFHAPIYHYVNEKNAHLIPLLEKTLQELVDEDYWGDRAKLIAKN